MTKYYDINGNYKAYCNDDKHLFNEAGVHIGSFSNGFLYDPKGIAVGHVKGKQILSKSGQPLYYTK
ncbi:MAG: 4-fold beta flower protein [Chryseolinea sp.]